MSHAQAIVLLADDFEDGDVSNWTHSGPGSTFASTDGGGLDGSSPNPRPGTYVLRTGFIAPSEATGPNKSQASINFTAPVAGNYTLDLYARSRNCSGCVMSYEILVDSIQLAFQSSTTFVHEVISLTALTAGVHTLTLGLDTDAASSGNFQAFFDDVCISTGGRNECFPPSSGIPLPGPLALIALGFLAILSRRQIRNKARI